MQLAQTKEREYRFKIALRMGLPIFAFIIVLIVSVYTDNYEVLEPSFYFSAILLLTFSIYFFFFLIYNSYDVKITESISKAFTREYFYKLIEKKLQTKKSHTLVLISIDNLVDINTRYGIKSGDKVIYSVVQHIEAYFKEKNIENFPMGHIKGGDFILCFDGKKEDFTTTVELLCLKSSEYFVDAIEVSLSTAITDSTFSDNLDYMVESLFELQILNRSKKTARKNNLINPVDLEKYVTDAIENKTVSIMTQDVLEGEQKVFEECFIKLTHDDEKHMHPKSYMKVVNKLGLSAEYDLLVLEKALEHYKEESIEEFAINISSSSLRNHTFLTESKKLLQSYSHTKLIFILSETQYYTQTKRYNNTLMSLKEEGIRICIDRLGSLHTSFLYLRDLEVDIVRFDASYTKNIENENFKSIIEGLNVMAHERGVKTWFRMLESDNAVEFAKSIKIDYMQGKSLAGVK